MIQWFACVYMYDTDTVEGVSIQNQHDHKCYIPNPNQFLSILTLSGKCINANPNGQITSFEVGS